MGKLKLSIVYYLNALPLSWGFMHGEERQVFDLDFSPPSRCADLLARGEVDIGLIPAIEYQRISGLQVVPGLSVASKRQVKSVLLLSKVPVSEIKSLAVDSSSRTSVCLLKILLRAQFKTDPVFETRAPDLETMLENRDAALLIGDVALKAETDRLYRYDLAEEWRTFTGKPFVFAFWGVRGAAGWTDTTVFEKSFEYGRSRYQEIVTNQAQQLGLSEDLIRTYITEHIDYSLDAENMEGLRLFFELAREYLLIDTVRGLEFL
jgi:chorismate dehydratase